MHMGNIQRDTMAGRVWRFLRHRRGEWWSTAEIMRGAECPCVSTRISEIRCQLSIDHTTPWRLDHRSRTVTRRGQRRVIHEYRAVRREE